MRVRLKLKSDIINTAQYQRGEKANVLIPAANTTSITIAAALEGI